MGNSKMSAGDRIDYLLDDHSFVELGGYVSARNTDYNLGAKKVKGDGVITGYGMLDGRMVYVYSQVVKPGDLLCMHLSAVPWERCMQRRSPGFTTWPWRPGRR